MLCNSFWLPSDFINISKECCHILLGVSLLVQKDKGTKLRLLTWIAVSFPRKSLQFIKIIPSRFTFTDLVYYSSKACLVGVFLFWILDLSCTARQFHSLQQLIYTKHQQDGVFLLPGCCDPFNEKALRAARGASFQLPVVSGNWSHLKALKTKFKVKMLAGDPVNVSDWSDQTPSRSREPADAFRGMPLC